jgi:hypothetical protein
MMGKRVRILALAVFAVALALGLASFGGSARSAPVERAAFPTGPVNLTMWWWG